MNDDKTLQNATEGEQPLADDQIIYPAQIEAEITPAAEGTPTE